MPTSLYQYTCVTDGETAISALQSASTLSKSRIKDAMNKGAVWLQRGSKNRRLRRATAPLQSGDRLSLYHDPEVLALTPAIPELLSDEKHYSIWVKPAGLLAQGTREGDHCSLLRQAELQLHRDVFLVHRLDREVVGLMLIAHSPKAAAAFSSLFARDESQRNPQNSKLGKYYLAQVRGQAPSSGEITLPVEGKPALTYFKCLSYDPQSNASMLEVELITGRKHQIRRHLAESGWPVLGDPAYGENNRDNRGLQLYATGLEFTCPLTHKARSFTFSP